MCSTEHGDASDNSDGPGCDVDACAPVEHNDLSDTSVGPIMDVDASGEFMLDPTRNTTPAKPREGRFGYMWFVYNLKFHG